MGNEVGRTGFHVTHEKSVKKRGAILDEMMRELKDESIERWAQRNPSIVVEDEKLNIAYVNNGDDRFVRCKDPKEVLVYGQQRLAKLSTPVKEPKLDPVTGKEKGGTTTSSMFVLHLPKSLCEEVKDFYPVLDDDGHETERRRSRWVARDRKEAMRYFKDALAYMAQEVIPGGRDAILGFDIQFSESTPHIQILADTFAPDPKHPGQLRTEFSRAYGSHRSVRDDKGRQMSGKAKFRRYHDGLKQRMVELGWPVERDVDPLRHDKTATKDMYGAMMDKQRALDEYKQELADERSDIEQSNNSLADQWENLDIARAEVKREREQLQKDKQKVLEEARSAGYAKGLEEGRAQADALREQARQQLDEAQHIYGEALAAPSITDAQARNLALFGAKALADSINKNIVDPDARVIVDKSFKSMERTITKNGKVLIEQASGVERAYGNELVRKRARVSQVQEAQKSLEDDGMEF
jgi:ATP synthase F0 sector subunit B